MTPNSITASKHFWTILIPQQLLATLAIVYLVTTGELGWLTYTLIFWFLSYVIGEGIFLHRYFAHKSFECNHLLPKFFSLCALLGGFATPVNFRAIHLAHHANSDAEQDPHSPVNGLWQSYAGWYLKPIKLGANIQMRCRELLRNDFYKFCENYKVLIWYATLLLLIVLDWRLALFTMGLGGAIGIHFACVTTSFAHWYPYIGYQRFATKDNSTNLWWLSWITWQGSSALQNNHHANPAHYHDSHAWYEFDIGKWIIPLIQNKRKQRLPA